MKLDISAMTEGFIDKVKISAKGLDDEDLQLIFVRKQKKNGISRGVTELLWWTEKISCPSEG